MKRCTKCGDEKPLEAFSKRHDTKDGLQHKCKACTNAYLSEHYAENRAAYAANVADLLRLQRGLCAVCRCDIRGAFEVDHIMPIKLGGANVKTILN